MRHEVSVQYKACYGARHMAASKHAELESALCSQAVPACTSHIQNGDHAWLLWHVIQHMHIHTNINAEHDVLTAQVRAARPNQEHSSTCN